MVNTKDRKHSGRREVFADDPDYPTQYEFWDDWGDFRDGMRYDPDESHMRPERMLGWWRENSIHLRNEKIRRQIRLRNIRRIKSKRKFFYSE